MPPQAPKVPVEERARRYIAIMPPSISGSNGHTALFNVVRTLLHGFGFSKEAARPLVMEFNLRCSPPWGENEINHKLNSVDGLACPGGRGYLLQDIGLVPMGKTRERLGMLNETQRKEQVKFEPALLKELAGDWARTVDLVWLANRSAYDPATLSAEAFLAALYRQGEQILVFTDQMTQGDALWPKEKVPVNGPEGVWFLPQPVDGLTHPNPRTQDKAGNAKLSRRSEESVQAYRYMLLESDEAPARDWLGFIVQAPLKIEALYTSGGRSVHALVRVDCRTKAEWDEEKKALMPFLMAGVLLGADRGTWSGVRLSRLPGCWREGKKGKDGRLTRYPRPMLQKLLYLRPGAECRPICELPVVRNVEHEWLTLAKLGISDADETGGETLKHALNYYAPCSEACRVAAKKLEEAP